MRYAIADPPYLGRGRLYYAGRDPNKWRVTPIRAADTHPDASIWDDEQTHRDLVRRLVEQYDGWAVALARDSLPVYLSECPQARVCVWHNPAAWPPGGRIHASWEPVLVWVPESRRAAVGMIRPRDVLVAPHPSQAGFTGAKPNVWTRWVLDMLGVEEGDEVDDLFGGSGAVAYEIAQGVLDLDL